MMSFRKGVVCAAAVLSFVGFTLGSAQALPASSTSSTDVASHCHGVAYPDGQCAAGQTQVSTCTCPGSGACAPTGSWLCNSATGQPVSGTGGGCAGNCTDPFRRKVLEDPVEVEEVENNK